MSTNREGIPSTPTASRRRFLASAGLAAAAAWLSPLRLFANEQGDGEQIGREEEGIVSLTRKEAATAKITVEPLRGNVSVLMGSGGNIAVFSGPDGKLLVDAGIPASRLRIIEALDAISPDPVRRLINTHWHFDHTDGNLWLHAAGATILAHENTRKRLSTQQRVADWNFTFPPAPTGALPTQVFNTERTLRFNGSTLALKYYGPAHTDTDISVHFAEADILHVGDTWWNGHYPFIDYSTGGSIAGTIRATEANLARISDKTLIIPGHGSVGNRSDLTAYRDMLARTQEKVAALKKQGRSLAEVVAAKPTAAYDAKWGDFMISPEAFTGLVYQGV
jgi:glyoxylase-like metal-dependent hydrolase (beta-lactamase superfamily II)